MAKSSFPARRLLLTRLEKRRSDQRRRMIGPRHVREKVMGKDLFRP